MNDKVSILYVEDEEDIRTELVEILEFDFSNILVACDGKEGLALYEKHHPDLIISDIQMPNMDGLTMCKKIRGLGSKAPVIITSAFNETIYKEQAEEVCVAHFLSKPINIANLNSAIKHALDNKEQSICDEITATI